MNSKTLSRHVLSLIGFLVFLFLAVGSMDDSSSSSSNTRTHGNSAQEQWFQGGTLHNATIREWRHATEKNKLATAADWLSATKWKGQFRSYDDFERIKTKAQMLADAVDAVIVEDALDSMQVKEIAAAIITMSNDLGP